MDDLGEKYEDPFQFYRARSCSQMH